MNWLITGGCGFIGTNLVKRILDTRPGDNIRIIDNLSVGTKEFLGNMCDFTEPYTFSFYHKPQGIELYINNIKNQDAALILCNNIDIVVHLAASTGVPVSVEFPRRDCMANIIGTLNYLEGARHSGVKKFIFASTSSVPGDHVPPYDEKLFPRPLSPYGASKGAGEAYCHVYNATFGLTTVALRFSNVYGPYSINKRAQLIPRFIRRIIERKDVEIFGDGSQTRDYCYVDDLIDVIMLSAEADHIGGEVFHIATNQETDVQTVVDFIFDGLSKRGIPGTKIKCGPERPGDPERNFSNVEKVYKTLGWKYKVGIEEGINKTIDWFLEGR